MRMMRYGWLRNMAAIVAAVVCFAAAWLGRRTRLNVLVEHVVKMLRKMMRTPDFYYYALVDGLRWLFVSHCRWKGADFPDRRRASPQMELSLAYLSVARAPSGACHARRNAVSALGRFARLLKTGDISSSIFSIGVVLCLTL